MEVTQQMMMQWILGVQQSSPNCLSVPPQEEDIVAHFHNIGQVNQFINDLNELLKKCWEHNSISKAWSWKIPQVHSGRSMEEAEESICRGMDQLVKWGMVGLIDWPAKTICRLYYPSVRVETETKGNAYRELYHHVLQYEELEKAHKRPIREAKGAAQNNSQWGAHDVLKYVTPRLETVSYVADGTTVFEQQSEKLTKVSEWKQLPPPPPLQRDPALVVGHYVVFGWK